jgi:hypothetical protein
MVFYNKEELRELVPSVFAEGPDEKRSDRYVFVSSEKIIDSMEEVGWGVTNARAPRTRKADPLHCRHELTFRYRDGDLSFEDPRVSTYPGIENAVVHPELRFNNSSDGSCRYDAKAGLFALICGNGMTISLQDFGSFTRKHIGFDPDDAYRITTEFVDKVPEFVNTVHNFRNTDMDKGRQISFAADARDLRWNKETNVAPQDLLQSRRREDDGSDLWSIYNRVQENLMRGGFSSTRGRRVREISNIKLSNSINEGLWDLAESYLPNAGVFSN